jgi:hypothetical protein
VAELRDGCRRASAHARLAGHERLRRGSRPYGLLQLGDKSGGADFDADDEEHVRELASLVGETLDALRAASKT